MTFAAPTSSLPPLVVEGIVKTYNHGARPIRAVDGVSFAVERGEVVALLGPNGSGKTTTLRAAGATLRLDAGRVLVGGFDVQTSPRQAKRRLGVVHQEDTLDPDLSVRENLLVHARYLGLPRAAAAARADELLARFGLAARAEDLLYKLSGGMRRKLSLARAFFRCEALILDEPTTGLDPQARLSLWGDLRGLLEEGVAILLSTHDMEEAERLADRVVLLDSGRVRAEGSPRRLIESETAGRVYEVRLPVPRLAEAEALAREACEAGARVRRHGGFLFLEAEDEARVEAWAKERNLPLTVRPANLGDVYLKATGKGLDE